MYRTVKKRSLNGQKISLEFVKQLLRILLYFEENNDVLLSHGVNQHTVIRSNDR